MTKERISKISKIVFENILLVLVYYFSGYISKIFADVVVIWPPTGISLAFFLLKGKRVLPAIFIGDFIVTMEIMGFNTAISIIFSLTVGFQALLTALIGRHLIAKFVGVNNPLIDNKSIGLFLLVGGPISMLLPSALALGVEYGLDLVPRDELLFDFFIWWLGGAIGIIIFTPLTLILLGKKKYYSRQYSVAIPLILLFILDVLFFNYIKTKNKNNLIQVFEQQAQAQHNLTANIMDDVVDEIHELKFFIENADRIDNDYLSRFRQHEVASHPNTRPTTFAWIAVVTDKARHSFETNTGSRISQHMPDGSVAVAETKEYYFPVQAISLANPVEIFLGLDIASNSRWKDALDSILINGQTEIIAPLHLYSANVAAPRLLTIVLPVYYDLPSTDLADKKRLLRGFVMSLMPYAIINDFIEQAAEQNIILKISGASKVDIFDEPEIINRYGFEYVESINEFHSVLDFTYFPANEFADINSSLPVGLIFLVGLGVTGLVGFLLLSVTGQTVQTQKLVEEKTGALNTERELLSAVFNSVQEGIMACDEKGDLTVLNQSAEKIFEKKLNGKPFSQWIRNFNLSDMDGNPLLKKKEVFFDKLLTVQNPDSKGLEFSILTGGNKKILKATSSLIKQKNNRTGGAVISFQDITLNKQYVNDLKKLGWAVEFCPVSVFMMDARGVIEYVNNKFVNLTGYSFQDVKGETPQMLAAGETPTHEYIAFWNTLYSGHEWRGELYNRKKNGDKYWVRQIISPIKNDQQKIIHFVSIQEDITKEKKAKEVLSHQASHDDLTSLLNRRECEKRLEQVLVSAGIQKSKNAFCYMDLDKFKIVNDTCGHSAGDYLLKEVCKIFQSQLRQRDTLARLGGDEFGLIVEHCTMKQAEILANQICQKISEYQFFWEGQEFQIGVSIGLAMIDENSLSFTNIMCQADDACYQAKKSGRGRVCVFS